MFRLGSRQEYLLLDHVLWPALQRKVGSGTECSLRFRQTHWSSGTTSRGFIIRGVSALADLHVSYVLFDPFVVNFCASFILSLVGHVHWEYLYFSVFGVNLDFSLSVLICIEYGKVYLSIPHRYKCTSHSCAFLCQFAFPGGFHVSLP